MKLKADLSLTMVEFNYFKELLKKKALMEDYKELYQRVVLPIGVIQQRQTLSPILHYFSIVLKFVSNNKLKWRTNSLNKREVNTSIVADGASD